ncbi:hypothetical protein AB1Y20_017893 [Prymnesium parvum]|uniref:Uncharacterized protein n=1 Tax=Prymnesium parvum TaxID=97485 RepID=A0AB34JPF6_PRYPA
MSGLWCLCLLSCLGLASASRRTPRLELHAARTTLAGVNAEAAAGVAVATIIAPQLASLLVRKGGGEKNRTRAVSASRAARPRRRWVDRIIAFLTDSTTAKVMMTLSIYWMAFVSWQVNRDRVMVMHPLRGFSVELEKKRKEVAKTAVRWHQDARPLLESAGRATVSAAIAAQKAAVENAPRAKLALANAARAAASTAGGAAAMLQAMQEAMLTAPPPPKPSTQRLVPSAISTTDPAYSAEQRRLARSTLKVRSARRGAHAGSASPATSTASKGEAAAEATATSWSRPTVAVAEA